MEKKKIISFIENLGIFLFLFVIGSGIVISPIFGDINLIDEGQFGAWITHMLHGQYLYKDIYAAYGPLYIYPAYLLAKIFGLSVFLIRIVYILLNVFVSVLIARLLLRKLKVPHVLELFSLFLLLVIPGFVLRQASGFLTIYLMLLAFEKKNYLWTCIAGISLVFSFLISSEIGIFAFLIFCIYSAYSLVFQKNIRALIKKISTILFFALLTALVFFILSNHEGWFFPYIQSVYDDLTIYSGIALPNGQNFPNAIYLLPKSFSVLIWLKYIFSKEILLYWLFFFYFAVFTYFAIRFALKKLDKSEVFPILISIYGFFLSIILVGRSGHFPFTLSPVFILFSYFLYSLFKNLKKSESFYNKLSSIFLMSLIILFSLRLISIYRPNFTNVFLIPKSIGNYKNNPKFVGPIAISNEQKKDTKKIQSFVFNNTKPTDKIFFFDNEPMLYLLVNRDNPTPYGVPEVANTLEKRLEVLNDLIKDNTKYVILDKKAWNVDGISNSVRMPEVIKYVKENYSKQELGNYTIYKKKTI